jgi:Cu/Ag efflux pump CusA
LDDPIFNGLAISLISGIFVSTALTLLVIPLLYFMAFKNKPSSVISGEYA